MSEKYLHFTASDFAREASFREWILGNNAEARDFWMKWTAENPSKKQEILQGIALLEVMRSQEATLTQKEIDNAIQKTISQLRGVTESQDPHITRGWIRWIRYAAALAILLLSWWATEKFAEKRPVEPQTADAGNSNWFKVENRQANLKNAVLPDGSKVVLDPGASVFFRYAEKGERMVRLSGSAFFDVVKNPAQPFRVSTGELLTTVLGTSFKISTEAATRETKVRVMTGRVEVSTVAQQNKDNTVLYPNQQVTYSKEDNLLTKSLVEQPVEVRQPKKSEYVYENVPIGVIFEELEQVYGVTIVYDKKQLANCEINASFGAEPFWDKLRLICRPVRATIEEKDGIIIVSSPGCNF